MAKKSTRKRVRSKARAAGHAVRKRVQSAKKHVQNDFKKLKSAITTHEKDLKHYIEKHPEKAAAIAAGIGAALGAAVTAALVRHKKRK